jgi:hypothetical protein
MDGRGDDLLGDPGNGRKPSDPDATGATGNSVGSYQPDQFESHQHEFSHGVFTNKGNPNENISAVSDNTGTINNASTITIIGGKPGSETRPRNVYVMYCIYTGGECWSAYHSETRLYLGMVTQTSGGERSR